MLNQKKIVVVMPTYNAAVTLHQTYDELPLDIVDEVILVDDGSSDGTVELASKMGLTVFQHRRNQGYGRNQKTCYREALKRGADIVIMLHPDYQYSPKLIVSLAGMIAYGEFDIALEILAQAVYFNYRIGEISCPARYFAEASSIGFSRSVRYGMGVLRTSLKFRLRRMGISSFAIFNPTGAKLVHDYYEQVR